MRRSSPGGVPPRDSASLLAALGEAPGLGLVGRLCDDGPMSLTRLTAGSHVTRQAITKHLRVMEQAGLVRSTRQGRESVWQLQLQRLEDARRCLALISKQWDNALVRLRKFVED